MNLIRHEIKYTDSQLLLVLQYRIEPVNFYLFSARKLGDLISELYKDNSNCEINAELDNGKPTRLNKAAFNIKSMEQFCGHVRVEASQTSVLGVGAFKTAQAIELTLSPLRPFGLGSIQNQLITAKRPLGTFRVENQCCFEAVLKIVFELVLGAWGTPKTIFSFDLPRFGAFSSRF